MTKPFNLKNGSILLSTEAPGGLYNAAQLKKIASICSDEVAIIKATEDQRLAIFVKEERADAIADELRTIGLGIRNYQDGLHQPITCIGELCPDQEQDALSSAMNLTKELADVTLNYPLKIGINGCGQCCVPCHTFDISIVGDSNGYQVNLGGKNSKIPEMASFIAEAVPPEKLTTIIKKTILLYRDKVTDDESLQDVIDKCGVADFVKIWWPYSQDAAAGDDPFQNAEQEDSLDDGLTAEPEESKLSEDGDLTAIQDESLGLEDDLDKEGVVDDELKDIASSDSELKEDLIIEEDDEILGEDLTLKEHQTPTDQIDKLEDDVLLDDANLAAEPEDMDDVMLDDADQLENELKEDLDLKEVKEPEKIKDLEGFDDLDREETEPAIPKDESKLEGPEPDSELESPELDGLDSELETPELDSELESPDLDGELESSDALDMEDTKEDLGDGKIATDETDMPPLESEEDLEIMEDDVNPSAADAASNDGDESLIEEESEASLLDSGAPDGEIDDLEIADDIDEISDDQIEELSDELELEEEPRIEGAVGAYQVDEDTPPVTPEPEEQDQDDLGEDLEASTMEIPSEEEFEEELTESIVQEESLESEDNIKSVDADQKEVIRLVKKDSDVESEEAPLEEGAKGDDVIPPPKDSLVAKGVSPGLSSPETETESFSFSGVNISSTGKITLHFNSGAFIGIDMKKLAGKPKKLQIGNQEINIVENAEGVLIAVDGLELFYPKKHSVGQ